MTPLRSLSEVAEEEAAAAAAAVGGLAPAHADALQVLRRSVVEQRQPLLAVPAGTGAGGLPPPHPRGCRHPPPLPPPLPLLPAKLGVSVRLKARLWVLPD